MIIQIGTEVDESRILWKHNEKDDWHRADIDDLIIAYESRPIRCKDCKHYYVLNEVRGNCSEYNFVEKIPIDYCSWAERKEE